MSDKVSLATLGAGSAIERFDYELQRVLNNIADINTKAESTREVILKVKIKPNDERDYSHVSIEVTSKLAAIKPDGTTFYLHSEHGETVATEYNPRQEKLSFDGSERKVM